jgi:hypothetical protein
LRRNSDGSYSLEYIQFYPEVEYRWFAAIQGYPGQRDSGDPCDNNACGLVSVTAILRNLIPSLKLSPKEAQNLLGVCLDTEGLYLDDRGLQTQVQQLAEKLGVDIVATYGYAPYTPAGRTVRFDDFYGDLRRGLAAGGWPIIAVGLNDDTDELQADLETNKHFVVVAGLSTDAYWNRENSPDSIWRWVKLYDPWLNRTRYYLASVVFDDFSYGKEYLIVEKR